jgi:class 3 adenylate cyclase/tetratricopeptide (TPR) repeat protein
MSDVGAWLDRIGLGQYADAFAANDIEWALLPELDHEALRALGVASVGHRLLILKAAKALGSAPDEPAAAVGPVLGPAQAERRQLTIMFCDLAGSTELAQSLDAEDLRGIMTAYQDAAKSTIEAYGGFVARYMGDGVLAYFGFPKAHEDDAERAIRAGLKLARVVPALPVAVELAVRVGIATGPVVVGDLVGEGASSERTVVGETPNLAARLQGVAEPNTVAIAPSTRQLAGGAVEYADLGEHSLKGIERPLRVWRAIHVAGASRFEATREHSLTPFSGRSHELAELQELLRAVSSSGGRSVLLVADAGVGKSRLLHELRVHAGAQRSVVGQCLSHGANMPFHPLLGVVRVLVGARASDDADRVRGAVLDTVDRLGIEGAHTADLLTALLEPTLEGQAIRQLAGEVRQAGTLRALSALICRSSLAQPLLLMIEDIHWIDRSSEMFLNGLVAEIASCPILFVATHRPGYTAPWNGQHRVSQLRLELLDPEESRRIVASILGDRAADPALRRRLEARAQGNPLFLEELSRAIADRGSDADLPDTLRGVLMSRIDGLQWAARSALQTASVLGREFHLSVLEAIWPHSESVASLLEELERLQMMYRRLEADERVMVFRHALIQNAAYESLLRSRRRELHAQAAQAVERIFANASDEMASILAYHYVRAERPAEAMRYLSRLADHSMRSYALPEARATLVELLSLVEAAQDGSERLALCFSTVFRLAQVEYLLGRFDDSVVLLERYRARLERGELPKSTAPCLFWLGHMLVRMTRYDEARAAAERAIAQASSVDDAKTMGQAEGVMCLHGCLTGDSEAGTAAGRRSVELLSRVCDPYWLGMTEFYLGMLDEQTGRHLEAAERGERVYEAGREIGDPRLQTYGKFLRGWALASVGAREAVAEARRALELAPDPTSRVYAQGFLAYAQLKARNTSLGLDGMNEAIRGIARIGFRPFESLFFAFLSEGKRELGDLAAAADSGRAGVDAAAAFPYPFGEAWARRALGRALAAQGLEDEAAGALREAEAAFLRIGAADEAALCAPTT